MKLQREEPITKEVEERMEELFCIVRSIDNNKVKAIVQMNPLNTVLTDFNFLRHMMHMQIIVSFYAKSTSTSAGSMILSSPFRPFVTG